MTAPTLIPLGKSDTIQPGDVLQLSTGFTVPVKAGSHYDGKKISDVQDRRGGPFPIVFLRKTEPKPELT